MNATPETKPTHAIWVGNTKVTLAKIHAMAPAELMDFLVWLQEQEAGAAWQHGYDYCHQNGYVGYERGYAKGFEDATAPWSGGTYGCGHPFKGCSSDSDYGCMGCWSCNMDGDQCWDCYSEELDDMRAEHIARTVLVAS